MAKAKSGKSVGTGGGFFDDPVQWIKDTADEAAENIPLLNRLKDPEEAIDAAVEKADPKPKPKPKPTPQYKSGSNPEIRKGEKKLKEKSKAEIEEIRRRLQAGEQVKVDE